MWGHFAIEHGVNCLWLVVDCSCFDGIGICGHYGKRVPRVIVLKDVCARANAVAAMLFADNATYDQAFFVDANNHFLV